MLLLPETMGSVHFPYGKPAASHASQPNDIMFLRNNENTDLLAVFSFLFFFDHKLQYQFICCKPQYPSITVSLSVSLSVYHTLHTLLVFAWLPCVNKSAVKNMPCKCVHSSPTVI